MTERPAKQYAVKVLPSAAKAIAALDRKIARQISKRIDALKLDPFTGSKLLEGENQDRIRRARSGDYRILFQVNEGVLLVVVVDVGHRREIYR